MDSDRVTGVFSTFVSNTATAAMMLTFLTPVFKALPANGKGRVALTLSIPVAANLGGMATPIGTPPNAIALKFLNDPHGLNLGIGFGQWTAFMLPYVLIMLFISWLLLKKFFPFTKKTIELHIEGDVKHNWRTVVVAVTFIVTVLFWMSRQSNGHRFQHGGHDSLGSVRAHGSNYSKRPAINKLERYLDGGRRFRPRPRA